MGKKVTTEDFIEKANKKHNFRYKYDKTIYLSAHDYIIIYCKTHGYFKQSANAHLNGQGCKNCGYIKNNTKNNISEFIKKANKVHKNKYNYKLSKYKKAIVKIKIICESHGIFEQTPNSHLNGSGCNKCGNLLSSLKQRRSLKSFIDKSNKIHNNKYNYSLVNYKTARKSVKIICPIHGIFEQLTGSHLAGKGCRLCSYGLTIYNKSNWIKRANGKQGTFYIIKCWNENEEFFKLGITFNSIKQRYNSKFAMPYNYKIIKEIKSKDLSYIWELEKRFKRIKKPNLYAPLIEFAGNKYECFK